MVEITELLWDDQNIAHIGGHVVTVPEVSEVVFGGTALFFDLDRPHRPGRIVRLRSAQGGRTMTQRSPADVDAFDEGEFDLATRRPADVRVGREPKSGLSVRFDAADIERLRERAATAGVGITQLVRTWVLERLDEPEPSAAVGDLMEALEQSLRAARTIKRAAETQQQAG